ncbi:MAG: hypothetical protein AUH85_06610 [Chloroflexi bacterium 13_1_40CM_4_68_4]|nr:MAG: hypothetical protein AUH85_06610 [Chloroflexi bacterium 13_1_40CM_4_68_4]
MSDPVAFAAVRLLAFVAAGVVVVRGVAGVRGERVVAKTGCVTPTPVWYDMFARPLGLVLMLGGIVVVAWAYATMGEFWSGAISAREDHRVIVAGPFAFVRHPVYAAYLLGVIGGALALADPIAAIAAIVSVPIMRGRAFAEERFLEARLGEAYRDYRRRVRMFVPGVF